MEADGDADNGNIRVLPDTCVELFLNYTGTPVAVIDHKLHKRSIVTSRMSRPMDVQMRKGAGVMAVCFQPGMAYQFIKIPMDSLSNTTVALSDLWGNIAVDMEDRLSACYNNEMRVNLMQNYLLKQLAAGKVDPDILNCLNEVQLSGASVSVNQFVKDTGFSQRHLSRKFHEHIGLSPKEYLRVSRFVSSLNYLKKYPEYSLTEIAYQSGYYDQAHFIRDYKAYAGYTPKQVLQNDHVLY
jgi:AraC-like DNA-binding protein